MKAVVILGKSIIAYLLSFRHYYYLIIAPLIVGIAIFFTVEKGTKGFFRCIGIFAISWIITSIITALATGSTGDWLGLTILLLVVITIVEAVVVTFIINPLIRKFYLKEN